MTPTPPLTRLARTRPTRSPPRRAKSTDPAKWKDQIQAVSGPEGEAFDWQQLPEAVKALQSGKKIAYKGVSGDFNYDDLGNMTTGTFSIWKADGDGNRTTVKEIKPDAEVKVG
jgi:neutral amino acid transport system substrate-binding protein